MAKLSHIEDIELKRAQEAMQQAKVQQAQQEAQVEVSQEVQDAKTPQEKQEAFKSQDAKASDAQEDASEKKPATQGNMTAQQEADFHGIETGKPMGVGHRFLIILAVLVTIAAILYIVNSWVHFI